MEVEVVTTSSGLTALAEDWRRLEMLDEDATFFSGYHCVESWWGSYGGSEEFELRLHVARQGGEVVGLLPLALHRQTVHRAPYAELRFASHGDTMGALVHPGASSDTVCRVLLEAVMSADDWDQLLLNYVPMPSPLANFVMRSEYRSSFSHLIEQPFLDLRDDQAAVRVPAKARKYRNKLRREQDVEFRVYSDNEGDILERLGRLHQHEKLRLVEQGRHERHSYYDDSLRWGHYQRLYARPGTALTFAYETADGRLIAARSAFRHRRSLLSWTSAYDPDFADYRLGKCLQLDILEHLREDGQIAEFDFGTGGYPWKFEWTDDCRHDYRLRIVRRPRPKQPSVKGAATQTRSPAPVKGRAVPGQPTDDGPRPRRPRSSGQGGPRSDPSRTSLAASRRLTGDLPLRLARRARRVQRRALGRVARREVWYLSSPTDLVLVAAPARLARADTSKLVIVLLGHGDLDALRDQVNADLSDALSSADVLRASAAELAAAARALGATDERVLAPELTGTADDGVDAARAVVRTLAREHPTALHVFPPADAYGAQARRTLRAMATQAMKHGLAVVRIDDAAPVSLSAPVAAAAEEFRHWDPDGGRYAVHRTAVSRYLARAAGAPASAAGPGRRRRVGAWWR